LAGGTRRQGGRPAAIFFLLGYPTPYGPGTGHLGPGPDFKISLPISERLMDTFLTKVKTVTQRFPDGKQNVSKWD
jgi:hypothetical protein